MKLFGRTSGYYIFWTGFVYFWVGIYFAVTHVAHPDFATLGFTLALSVPLWCPPVARYFNMEPLMFNWFKKSDYSNVVKFPGPVSPPGLVSPPAPPVPAVDPDPITYYSIGPTSDGRLNFKIGYSSITMNKAGIRSLINMLESAYANMSSDDEDETE